jgi:hypothetical protein
MTPALEVCEGRSLAKEKVDGDVIVGGDKVQTVKGVPLLDGETLKASSATIPHNLQMIILFTSGCRPTVPLSDVNKADVGILTIGSRRSSRLAKKYLAICEISSAIFLQHSYAVRRWSL